MGTEDNPWTPENERDFRRYVGDKFMQGLSARDREDYKRARDGWQGRTDGHEQYLADVAKQQGYTQERGWTTGRSENYLPTQVGRRYHDIYAQKLDHRVEIKSGRVDFDRKVALQLAKDKIALSRGDKVEWIVKDLSLVHEKVRKQLEALARAHPGKFLYREVALEPGKQAINLGRELLRERERVKEREAQQREAPKKEAPQKEAPTRIQLLDKLIERTNERGAPEKEAPAIEAPAIEAPQLSPQERERARELLRDQAKVLLMEADARMVEGLERRLEAPELTREARTQMREEVARYRERLREMGRDPHALEQMAVVMRHYEQAPEARLVAKEREQQPGQQPHAPEVAIELSLGEREPVRVAYDSQVRQDTRLALEMRGGNTEPQALKVIELHDRSVATPVAAIGLREMQRHELERKKFLERHPELKIKQQDPREISKGLRRERG